MKNTPTFSKGTEKLTRVMKAGKEYIEFHQPLAEIVELPYTPEVVEKLKPHFTEETHFLVRGGRHDRLYGIPQKEWEELSHEDAIDFGIYRRRRDKHERS